MKQTIILIMMIMGTIVGKAQSVGTLVKVDTVRAVWSFNNLRVANNNDKLTAIVQWQLKDSISKKVLRTRTFTYADSSYNQWWDNFNSAHSLAQALYSAEGIAPLDSNKVDSLFLNRPGKKH